MLYFPAFLNEEMAQQHTEGFKFYFMNIWTLRFQIIPSLTIIWYYYDFNEYTVTTDGIDNYKAFPSRYIKGGFSL